MLLYALLFSNTCLAPVRWTSPEERQQVKEILKNSGVLDRSDRSGWPSVRVHHTYPTVEARACDLPTRKKECLMLAALMQAYARASFRTNGDAMGRRHALIGNRRQALLENARNPHDRVIQENHFSVRRFGIHGRMVDYATGENISTQEAVSRMVKRLEPDIETLGSRKYIYPVLEKIFKEGTGADRQRAIYEHAISTGKTPEEASKAVLDYLIAETKA